MDIVVYINLTTEAIEASGQSVEAMLEAQARLLRRLTDPSRQRAIINIDGALLAEASPARPCTKRRTHHSRHIPQQHWAAEVPLHVPAHTAQLHYVGPPD